MFDLDAGKLLIVGVIALIFIPPKDLPRVLRQVGQFVGKMRRMAADFQGQFMDAMRDADMADLRREAEKLAAAARVDVGHVDVRRVDLGLDAVHDLDRQMVAQRPAEPAPETSPDAQVSAGEAPPALPPPDAEASISTAPHSA
jgi:sec-independent protein translocase protein TatB